MRIFMGTLCRESSVVVIRAISCVMMVAKTRCHVVKNKADESQAYFVTGDGELAYGILMSRTVR